MLLEPRDGSCAAPASRLTLFKKHIQKHYKGDAVFKGMYRSALGLFLTIDLLTFSLAQVDIFTLAKEGTLYDVVISISDGVAFDESDAYGQTPLMYAARDTSNPEVLRILLELGADPSLVNEDS